MPTTVTIYPFGVPQQWTAEVQDDGEDETPDPPKCKECDGKGYIELFTGVVECEPCGGSGY